MDLIPLDSDYGKLGNKIFCNYCNNGYHDECIGCSEDYDCECTCE